MNGRTSRIIILTFAAFLGATLAVTSQTTIQKAPNEELKKREDSTNVEDGRPENRRLWVLDFKFKNPRLVKVNIPARGQRVVWYMWYQVINTTNQPHTFIPEFELVTHDTAQKGTKLPMIYRDEIMPAAQEAIAKIEDPNGYYKIKNSVTISEEPIPVSLPKAMAKAVAGVAIWVDHNEIGPDDDEATRARKKLLPKLAESDHYSVFVAGLSNGYTRTDDGVVRRKTLQLSFQRKGDQFNMKSEEIRYKGSDWLYRASPVRAAPAGGGVDAPKDKDKK